MAQIRKAVLISVIAIAALESAARQGPRFFPDDPIQSMPAPLPVKDPAKQRVNDTLDFLAQSKKRKTDFQTPAEAVNTLGEAPDSEWFTNRHALHRMSRSELQRDRGPASLPAPPFMVLNEKTEGIMPGFVLKDSKGRTYFAKGDPPDHPELATGAEAIVANFLYAIGYNTPENDVVDLKLSDLRLSSGAKMTLANGQTRNMMWEDVEEIADRFPQRADGTFRIVASLAITGHSIGPFLYEGTRPDDPNDIVLHENRRDLRGLYVFSAWLNNTDAKAANTLDTIVEEHGVRFIRHHLIDFASALGSDGDSPKDPRLGNEYMLATPAEALMKFLSLGLPSARWEREHFPKLPAVGNFEFRMFDPDSWRPDFPNPAFVRRLPDDDFWAAKHVMAFSDDDIRAIVETGHFSDPRSAAYITAVLKERRDKIGRTFFSKLLPLDNFRVENLTLQFDDLSVRYRFHNQRQFRVRWFTFDNIQHTHGLLPGDRSTHLPGAADGAPVGSYFCATIDDPAEPLKAPAVYIRKEPEGYKVVGIDRTWK
jgi:hypothetical protein